MRDQSMKESLFVKWLLSSVALSLLVFQIPAIESSEAHDVAVIDVTVFPSGTFYPSMSVSANVTVENQGTSDETFNVTLYAGNLTIETLTVTHLAPGLNTTLTFEWKIFPYRIIIFPPPWDPTVIMSQNLTLKAEAEIVPGEIDIADNVYLDGIINVVWMVPDINGDGKIDIKDIATSAIIFGTTYS